MDIDTILEYLGAAVAVITALHAALVAIAPLTKTDIDDKAASKAAKALDWLRGTTGRLGIDLERGKRSK